MLRQMVAGWFTKQKLAGVLAKRSKVDLEILGVLLKNGTIKPVIDRTYSLAEVPEAIRYIERGHARGKVVIQV
jgi:NADPH:quinone reductase-like Zn-dependent oxidoreductase